MNIELPREKDENEVNNLSPLTWAYVGDGVYELYIRSYLISKTKLKPHELHLECIKYVSAKAQSNILKNIMNFLEDDEKEIVRRARNTDNHHIPKNAEPEEYMYSTAFEGLIGFLYLSKKDDRLEEILKQIIKIKEEQ